MSWLTSLFSSAADATPLGGIVDIGSKLIDRLLPDPAQATAAKLKLLELQQSGELAKLNQETGLAEAQARIDKVEAGSSNLFVSGWRPAIGWVCAGAFAWAYIGQPLAAFIAAASGYPLTLPSLDLSVLMPVLLGMLGLGGLHRAENVSGVTHL